MDNFLIRVSQIKVKFSIKLYSHTLWNYTDPDSSDCFLFRVSLPQANNGMISSPQSSFVKVMLF